MISKLPLQFQLYQILVKMNQEDPDNHYEQGDYVDFISITWIPKIITEITPDRYVRLKDIRNNLISQSILITSTKIKPFRIETNLRGFTHGSIITSKSKPLNIQLMQQRVKEINQFDTTLSSQTPKQIIQFLRGKYYFLFDQIILSQIDREQYFQSVINCFKQHLAFFLKYLQSVNFKQYNPKDIYSSSMNAYCSAFVELMDVTVFCLGVNTDFDTFKKYNSNHFKKTNFDMFGQEWTESQLFPLLADLKQKHFTPNIIFSFFNLLLLLYKRNKISDSEPLSTLFTQLYNNLIQNNDNRLLETKDIQTFLRQCPSIFKIMYRTYQGDGVMHEESNTQKIQSQQQQSKRDQFHQVVESQIVDSQKFTKIKKIEFRIFIIKKYLNLGKYDYFLKEMQAANLQICKQFEIGAIPQYNQSLEQLWPTTIKNYLNFIKNQQIIAKILENKTLNDFQFINQSRQCLLRIFLWLPTQVLLGILKARKFVFYKYIFNRPIKLELVKELIKHLLLITIETQQLKEAFDFFKIFTDWLKLHFPQEQHNELRTKVLQKMLQFSVHINTQQTVPVIQSFLDNSDPLKQSLLNQFINSDAITYANQTFSLFCQTLIFKHSKRHHLNKQTYYALCQFMKIKNCEVLKYEKRKGAVINMLHYQFNNSPEGYLEYLSIFLNAFCHQNHKKNQHLWNNLSVYPLVQSNNRQFMQRIDKQFCFQFLKKMKTLHYQLDIKLYYLLLLKYNHAKGNIILRTIQEIQSVLKVPQFIQGLFTAFFNVATKKNLLVLLQKYTFELFQKINSKYYQDMLIVFLDMIINCEGDNEDVLQYFTSLKVRKFQLDCKRSKIDVESAHTYKLKLISKRTQQRLQENSYINDKYLNNIKLKEQKKYCKEISDVKISDTFEIIKLRIAAKFNLSPIDFDILCDDEILSGESLKECAYKKLIKLRDAQLLDGLSEDNNDLSIYYKINERKRGVSNHILQLANQIYYLFPGSPNTSERSVDSTGTQKLLQGLDLMSQNWDEYEGLSILKYKFMEYLQKQQITSQQEQQCSASLNILLDFYIWKIDNHKNYHFQFLIKELVLITDYQDTVRNFKIMYLIKKSNNIHPKYCEQLLSYIIPAQEEDKKKVQEIQFFVKNNSTFSLYVDLVFDIVEENEPNCLQFLFNLKNINKFRYKYDLNKRFIQFWKKIYRNTSLHVKQQLFLQFQSMIVHHNFNIFQLQYLISEDITFEEAKLNKNLLNRMVIGLIKIGERDISITNGHLIEALLQNIRAFLEINVTHQIIYSKHLQVFIMQRFLSFNQNVVDNVLTIIRHMSNRQENRLIYICFFSRIIEEKEWFNKPNLLKSKAKEKQLQFKDLVGLRNPHSICYINSFLQQLYHINIFKTQLFGTSWNSNSFIDEDLIYQLKLIFINLQQNREPVLHLTFLKAFKNLQGDNTEVDVQMDVDQFRNMLFDRIQKLIPAQNNFVQKIFNGKQTSIIKSKECEHQSRKVQDFSSLCIQVKNFQNLAESIDNYLKPEILEDENAYHCDDCQKKVKAEKYIELNSFPPYLTFVLKRFEYVAYRRLKINSYFKFPLDSFAYFPEMLYKLKGIIIHQGISQAGHYISLIKHNKIWYQFNDSYVSQVSEQYVIQSSFGSDKSCSKNYNSFHYTKNAYILIYESDQLPVLPVPDRPYNGIQNIVETIKRNRQLKQKQNIFFQQNYLQLVNYMVQKYPSQQSFKLLYHSLTNIFLKFKKSEIENDSQFIKSLSLLNLNKSNMSFIWSDALRDGNLNAVSSIAVSHQFRLILCDLLVESCYAVDQTVLSILQDCLKRIYRDHRDLSFYFCFLRKMAIKFNNICQFLNERRIVGRIIDITLPAGVIAQKYRNELKDTTNVQMDSFNANSITLKDLYNHHKWGLLVLVLEQTNFNLHQIEKDHFVFQTTYEYFRNIFDQASNKATLNKITQYFVILCSKNQLFCQKLLIHIADMLPRDKADDLRKYLRVLKGILSIEDNKTNERCHKGVNIFNKCLQKYDNDKNELAVDYVWQWMLKIANKNWMFRNKLRQFKLQFQFLFRLKSQGYRPFSYPQNFKIDKSKHKFHGLNFPSKYSQIQAFHKQKIQKTNRIFSDQAYLIQNEQWDSDGELQDAVIMNGSNNYMRYSQFQGLGYRSMKIQLSIGDCVVWSNDQMAKNKTTYIMEKYNDKLSVYYKPKLKKDEATDTKRRSSFQI